MDLTYKASKWRRCRSNSIFMSQRTVVTHIVFCWWFFSRFRRKTKHLVSSELRLRMTALKTVSEMLYKRSATSFSQFKKSKSFQLHSKQNCIQSVQLSRSSKTTEKGEHSQQSNIFPHFNFVSSAFNFFLPGLQAWGRHTTSLGV